MKRGKGFRPRIPPKHLRPRRFEHGYSLRGLIISLNLLILLLPLVGIGALRILESFLHRQTEAKLIAEGAYISNLYVNALKKTLKVETIPKPLLSHLSALPPPIDSTYRPYFARIDLWRDPILEPASDGVRPPVAPRPAHRQAGILIEPLLKKVQKQNLSAVRVLDLKGVVVASTGTELGLDLSQRREVAHALQGYYAGVLRRRESNSKSHGLLNRAGRVRIFVAMPILEGKNLLGVVYLSRTSLSLFRDVWDKRYSFGLLALITFTVLGGILISHMLTKPLNRLVMSAKYIAAGQHVSLKVGRTASSEAHALAAALQQMVIALEKRLEYVKEFARNVSHEFKTPLTSMRGSIELLKDNWNDMSAEERERFIDIIAAENRRMERLIQRLLELTRLEAAGASHDSCDAAAIATTTVHNYTEAGHQIVLHQCAPHCRVPISADMLETLLINLIENALKHGQGKSVTVRLSPGPLLQVQDAGPGISAANQKRIFERFFTTARASGGTGLGLSMVKAIVEAHHATLHVASQPGNTVFTIDFRKQ